MNEHPLTNIVFDRTDIRKPATRKAQIHRPVSTSAANTSATPSDSQSAEDLAHYTEPVSDDEDNDDDRHIAIATDEAAWANLPAAAAAEARAFREENTKQDLPVPVAKSGGNRAQEVFTKLTPANLSRLLSSKYDLDQDRDLNTGTAANPVGGDEADVNASGISVRTGRVEYISSFRAQAGKRIAIPVRIEPKVFFANERTS